MQWIEAAISRLASVPRERRPGRVAGTRELVVPGTSFVVAYRPTANTVDILSVVHAARLAVELASNMRERGEGTWRAAISIPAMSDRALYREPRPANSSRPASSFWSPMTRGTLFWPPSLPRLFIQAAKVPGGAAYFRRADAGGDHPALL